MNHGASRTTSRAYSVAHCSRLVDRRLVDDELVAVVQAVGLAGEDAERQGQQGDRIERFVAEDVDAEQQRQARRGHVGDG